MRVEWKTVWLIICTYLGWGAAGWLLWPQVPWLGLVVLVVLAALHSSLVHEAIHGHPTRKRFLNEVLVGASLGLIWPYRRFRTLHLKHHHDAHLTDPFEDPESYYHALWRVQTMPRWVLFVLRVNNTMLGRIILGPLLGAYGLIAGDVRAIRAGDGKVLSDWLCHFAGLVPVLAVILFVFEMPLWLYLLAVSWPAHAIISIRTFAEHRWFETVDGRTIIVEKSPLAFLFLNNNLHIVHHKHPSAPWYELPNLYRNDRSYYVALNEGYVYPNYWSLFRSYALRQKEWVDHPELYQTQD